MNDYNLIVAQALVDGAHMECPYSKATHGNIASAYRPPR